MVATEAASAPDADASAGAAPSKELGAQIPPAQVPGRAIAINAQATLQTDDVRVAVGRITSTVTARGGRVAAADIDYAPPGEDGVARGSRATLTLAVPPDQLQGVADELDDLGTVLSFDQLAEDVTDQLTDLDTRIANLQASVERVRALYEQAVDIDSIVRLEAELTARETDLEMMLASQQGLEDRVTMSTLTIEVVATPEAIEALDTEDNPGVLDALSSGWNAFVGGLFTIVLVLAAIAPFVLTALVLALIALSIRRVVLRRRSPLGTPALSDSPERAPASAGRPD